MKRGAATKYLVGVFVVLAAWAYAMIRILDTAPPPAPPRVVVTVSPSPLPEPTCWETIIRYTDNGQTERTTLCK